MGGTKNCSYDNHQKCDNQIDYMNEWIENDFVPDQSISAESAYIAYNKYSCVAIYSLRMARTKQTHRQEVGGKTVPEHLRAKAAPKKKAPFEGAYQTWLEKGVRWAMQNGKKKKQMPDGSWKKPHHYRAGTVSSSFSS